MESFVITWRELLIVVVVVLAIYVAELLLLLRANKTGRRPFGLGGGAADKIQLLRLETLESQVEELQQQLEKLEAKLEKHEAPREIPSPAASPYSQAIQMAQQGLGVDEVAANCGISRGEAELIVAMHRARTP